MTSSESNESNSLEQQGINIEIRGVELRVLPIPENKLNANNPLELNIDITNSNIAPFRFNRSGTLIPQVVDSDGQVLQMQEPKGRRNFNKDSNYLVQHGESNFLSSYAKLSWRNKKLQLQISDIYPEEASYWTINDIKPGTYQLRFIYRTNIETAVGVETVRLYTQFITLRLIEPVATNRNTVEVDGIRFETLVPQQLLTIPKKQPDAITPVQFGLRVTNRSSTPYRFKFHGLKPEIQNMNGQSLYRVYNTNATFGLDESHFLLAMPGETLTCFVDGELRWYVDSNQLVMQGRDSIGGYWSFQTLNPGKYRLRFTYSGPSQSSVVRVLRGVVIEDLWTGIVPTPFIEFRLAE
jgi:hypothetical protein